MRKIRRQLVKSQCIQKENATLGKKTVRGKGLEKSRHFSNNFAQVGGNRSKMDSLKYSPAHMGWRNKLSFFRHREKIGR
jgi:hypothetical protein